MDNSAAISEILSYILLSLGCWGVFRKCGIPVVWAFVPIAREYYLGLCADRERDGRNMAFLSITMNIISIAALLMQNNTELEMLLGITALVLIIGKIVYCARVYLGLTKVFNRRKRWVFLFLFFEDIVLILWGWHPAFKVDENLEHLQKTKAAEGLNQDITGDSDALTININERKVKDFIRTKTLLRDIHMVIPKGHMVLLLGGSGAGKTTFVNAVTGYEKADAKIELGNNDVYRDYDKMMYDIGFVPQQDLMRVSDTVSATLADAAGMRLPTNVHILERRKRVDEALEEFGLSAVRTSLAEKLSGGQRKRLSIAMEFISDPTLFFLDEPDSGLDGIVARGLFEKLRAIADQNKIVIVITHTPDRVIDLFDDVIVLAKDSERTGRLAYYGPVSEAYGFFGKDSMEDILRSINQKEEGGEGRAEEFVEKYAEMIREKVG